MSLLKFLSPILLGVCALTSMALFSQPDSRSAKAQLTTQSDLTVEITGLRNAEGQVCFSLFESSAGFPDDSEAVVANQCVVAAAVDDLSDIAVTFEGLETGTYAVTVLHDENSDQQINRGTFGIPTEGFGFSRNPTIQTGAPEFYETAVFVFGRTNTRVEMVYF